VVNPIREIVTVIPKVVVKEVVNSSMLWF